MFNGGNADFSMPVMPAYANGGNNGGMGGWGDGWWAIIIFAMIFGWGNGGWGNGFGGGNGAGLQGAVTRADLCEEMGFDNLNDAVRGVQQGLCDGFYAVNTSLLNGFNGVDNAVCTLGYQTQQGFAGVDNAICSLGYNVQQGINSVNTNMMQGNFGLQQAINDNTVAGMQNTNALQAQLAQCCCDNRAGQKDIQYQMATDTCAVQNTIQNTTRDVIDNQNCNTRQILDFLVNDKISTLQTENQALRLAASQSKQNEYLLSELKPCPSPAYLVCNPYTGGYNGYSYGGYGNGYNNGCGCGNNSGCGCC